MIMVVTLRRKGLRLVEKGHYICIVFDAIKCSCRRDHLANDEVDLVLYEDFDLRSDDILNVILWPSARVGRRLG